MLQPGNHTHTVLVSTNWIETVTGLLFRQVERRKHMAGNVSAIVSAAEKFYDFILKHLNLFLELLIRSLCIIPCFFFSSHLLISLLGLTFSFSSVWRLQSTLQVMSKSHFLFQVFLTPREDFCLCRMLHSNHTVFEIYVLLCLYVLWVPWGKGPYGLCLLSNSVYIPEIAYCRVRKPGIQTCFLWGIVNVTLIKLLATLGFILPP